MTQTYTKISYSNNLLLELSAPDRLLFAKFLVYKYTFNSIIYNFNTYRAAKEKVLPYTLTTIANHVRAFKRKGWVEDTKKGHLRFKTQEEICVIEGVEVHESYRHKIVFKPGESHEDLIIRLYAVTIPNKARQQNYARTEASDSHKQEEESSRSNSEISLQASYETMAIYWGVSKTQARNLLKSMVDLGLVDLTQHDTVEGKSDSLPVDMRRKGYYTYKGNVMKRQSTIITCLFATMDEFYNWPIQQISLWCDYI